jgi:hypothetical protein
MVPRSLKDSLGLMTWIVNERTRLCQDRFDCFDSLETPESAGRRQLEHKKIGAESSDPNRHSQPRLPGSVVGSESMLCTHFANKITEVNVQK